MSAIRHIALGKYDIPKPIIDRTNDWVLYGEKDDFFQRLIDAKASPTNGALINTITDLIYGQGLYAKDAAKNTESYVMMVSLFTENCMRQFIDDYYTFGIAYLQVVYSKDRTTITEVEHLPTDKVRLAKCNDEGVIDRVYYSDDWKEVGRKNPPKPIPTFGNSTDQLEVFVLKSYKSGHFYYPPVDYFGGLPYSDLEIALAAYHINNVKNKFSANAIINFNNGTPTEEQQVQIEQKIKRKFQGEEGEGILVAFNDSKETAATLEGFELPDAHSQYEFISKEAASKIMVSHRVTSPILVGLGGGGGLGNNADELRTASTLFDFQVIQPKQREVCEMVKAILAVNGASLDVYIVTTQPLEVSENKDEAKEETPAPEAEVTELKEEVYSSNQIASALEIMEAVSLKTLTEDQAITFLIQMLQFDPVVARSLFKGGASSIITSLKAQKKKDGCCQLSADDNLDELADELISLGEDEDEDEWELISESPVDYDNINEDVKLKRSFFSRLVELVSTGTARAGSKSDQDRGLYKIRYQYAPLSVNANSRAFCKKMVAAKKVYRKEDIEAMGEKAVNPGWGANGSDTYSIWFYKGGGNCHHYWMRKVYFRKRKAGKFLPNDGLNNDNEVSANAARKAGVDLPKNDAKVAKLPTDMKNNGFLNPR